MLAANMRCLLWPFSAARSVRHTRTSLPVLYGMMPVEDEPIAGTDSCCD